MSKNDATSAQQLRIAVNAVAHVVLAWGKLKARPGAAWNQCVTTRGTKRHIWVAAVFSISLLGTAELAMAQGASRVESLAAWAKIHAVLQHPRCLNCHQAESPLQGDSRRTHIPKVVRGPENHGVSAMKCGNCHNELGNNPTSRTPGAPHWQLAPVSMLWQGLQGGALCRSLKDPLKNGKRSLDDIITHMGTDKLVLWGWNPGAGREAVPLAHEEFMKQMQVWVAGGAACPQ